MTGRELVRLLESSSLRTSTEAQFQDSTEQALKAADVEFVREHSLSRKDRPDFMVGSIALELKISGSFSEVLLQVQRYSQHDDVSEIVLLTSKSRLCKMPPHLSRKPIHVALISRGLR